MLCQQDLESIRRLAREYGLTRVLLFGSACRPGREPRDIDLAVEGLDPKLFFEFCGQLLFALSLPVDVFDLSQKGQFAELVRREGVSLYG